MQHQKPVRKCHGCPLNLGRYCWVFQYPRGQWRDDKDCRMRDDATVHASFQQWRKRPTVKNRKTLRQEEHRGKRASLAGEGVAWLRERGLL
jgi:hypothetical protein